MPVIVVTGNRADIVREHAEQAGCAAFLWKPFSGETILSLLGSIARDSPHLIQRTAVPTSSRYAIQARLPFTPSAARLTEGAGMNRLGATGAAVRARSDRR